MPTLEIAEPQTALLSMDDPESLGLHLKSGRERLHQRIREGMGGLEAALAYSDLVDSVLRRMLDLACLRAEHGSTADSVPIAVVATGGYGRRELCPHSDIDITFIPHRDNDPLVDRIIKEMFTLVMRVFMDANGLSVGYAYRLLTDCGNLDHQTLSGLLDARLVVGSDRLFIKFENEYWSQFNAAEFIFTKLDERRKSRDKFGTTPRLVEPNLKEGAGGLRDLQTAIWMTQALHHRTAADVRGSRVWSFLEREATITESESRSIAAAKEFLLEVRNALHVITGAERDQLVVTRQEEVADLLGYSELGTRNSELNRPPVERFMRDYYRHAASIHRIASDVMRRAEQSRLFLGIGLDSLGREIVPANLALAAEDPVWMLWACELAQKYDLGFSDDLARAIASLLQSSPPLRDVEQASEVFQQILASPKGAYPTLQRMSDLGILGWLLPEVGELMDLIPYDQSHDYTVGQHTLNAVRYLDSLRSNEGPEEMSDLRRLMAEIPNPAQLYLATLLHDAGKTDDDRPHAEVGEQLAWSVCARLRWDAQGTANVGFLVRHHLLMAETSRLRDLNLDETIREFISVVDDVDRLNMLYLLTYADTSAVGSGVWTQVKARFLRDLYRRAERMLAADDSEYQADPGLTRTRRRLLKELSVEDLPPAEVAEHVESMPAPYILNTSLEEMALHIGFVRRARRGEPAIEFHDERNSTYTEVTVCALDDPQPGLLSKIAGVLYAADLDVHSAQVFTRVSFQAADQNLDQTVLAQEQIAIDTLWVDFRGRQLTPGKRRELETNLTAVLTGRSRVEEVLAKRKKPHEIGGPVDRLNVRNDLSDIYTIVEVSSPDERAMLYRTSGALSALRWDIHSARVSQFKGRSVASFYVTGAKQLKESDAIRALTRLMPLATPRGGI